MVTEDMHETIRGLYQGVLEPQAWQRSLSALCDLSQSERASLLVFDPASGNVRVRQTAALATLASQATPHDSPQTLSFSERLNVGGWFIHRRDTGFAATLGAFPQEDIAGVAPASMMTCLIDRQPGHEIYLSLQRPAGADGFLEADARALDWIIPHLREAVAMRDRAQAASTHGRVSANLLNQLPFGVIVFTADGEPLLANAAGEPWIGRLMPIRADGTADGTPAPGGQGWRLSKPFHEIMRGLTDAGAPLEAGAIHAVSTDGHEAQIVAMRLTPGTPLSSACLGQPLLVAIHESHGTPRAVPTVLRDLYGLTPAETRLAALLTTGIGLPEASIQLGIKRETGRSQLKSIFTKTNTSTQAQLAHLLTRLGSVLAEPAR
ncbi:DNA-binding CsgD family transcriptional regulator [Cupriavidus metallidurans]